MSIILFAVLIVTSYVLISYFYCRSPYDVFNDLSPDLYKKSNYIASIKDCNLTVVIFSLALIIVFFLNQRLIIGVAAISSVYYLIYKFYKRKKIADRKFQVEAKLPIAIERLLMTVQSGLDIIPAIEQIYESEDNDPTNDLFVQLHKAVRRAELGSTFDLELMNIKETINLRSIKNIFNHIAFAHREGSEITTALSELADAVQKQFEENIEEEIAKMPAKAILPMILTFAGLIICFLTSPILQVLDITTKSGLP